MSLSGGLFWHWRAWRSQALWRPTYEQITSWLQAVQPRSSELLLIGASAGWMMPSAWLQGFSKVTVWDIDPLAAPLFRWRHAKALKASGTQLVCHTADAIADLGPLINSQPNACIFFDNVLGQYRFHCKTVEEASQKIAQIRCALRGREWGSLHDAYSGPVERALSARNFPAMEKHTLGHADADVLDQAWLHKLGAKGEWLDHLTDAVFTKGTVVHHIAWPYQPRYCHWLQAGWVHA
jgi:hypothetical protein